MSDFIYIYTILLCYVCLMIIIIIFFVMIRRPPRSTRTDTLVPYTTLFRSLLVHAHEALIFSGKDGSYDTPWILFRFHPTIETLKSDKGLFNTLTRSEEHTSELQSLMRISYAVFCLKKKKPSI